MSEEMIGEEDWGVGEGVADRVTMKEEVLEGTGFMQMKESQKPHEVHSSHTMAHFQDHWTQEKINGAHTLSKKVPRGVHW